MTWRMFLDLEFDSLCMPTCPGLEPYSIIIHGDNIRSQLIKCIGNFLSCNFTNESSIRRLSFCRLRMPGWDFSTLL